MVTGYLSVAARARPPFSGRGRVGFSPPFPDDSRSNARDPSSLQSRKKEPRRNRGRAEARNQICSFRVSAILVGCPFAFSRFRDSACSRFSRSAIPRFAKRKSRSLRTGFPKLNSTPPVPYAQRLKTFFSLGGRLLRNFCRPVYGLTSFAPVSTSVIFLRQRAVIESTSNTAGCRSRP